MSGAQLRPAPIPIAVPQHLVAARALNHPAVQNYANVARRRKQRHLRRIGAMAAFTFEAALGLGLVAALIFATR